MQEELYQKVPEEFSISQVRPRFHFDINLSAKAFAAKFNQGLKQPNSPCKGEANETYATLYFPRDKRHYWSPQLTLTIDQIEANKCHIRGLYGPRPPVWTMFIFFYALIGVLALFVLMIGGSQLMLGKSGMVLWFLPLLIAAFFSLYGIAYLGKKKGKPEIGIMHNYLMEIIEVRNKF